MVWKKGVATPGAGRKGYELEKKQLELMNKIVSCDLKLVEKIYSGKGTEKDFKKLVALQMRIGKYLDKLHANKTDITSGGEKIEVIPIYAGKSIETLPENNGERQDIEVEKED